MQTKYVLAVVAAVAGLLATAEGALARPVYAMKEWRSCAYCHVNPRGGGDRNKRGVYYAMHKHTFEGYDEEKVMGRPKSNVFRLAWQETLPPTTLKVAVASPTPDGANRLILLLKGTQSESRAIEVRKWDGKGWATEFSSPAPDGTDRLAAGRFAPDSPAVIVTTRALWYWDGAKYAMRPAPRPVTVVGSVVLLDGTEKLLVWENASLKMHAVDLKSGNWLASGQDPPASAKASFFEMKGQTEELKSIGVPDVLAGGGVLGLWDAGRPQPFFYAVQIDVQLESTGVAKPNENLVIKAQQVYLSVLDPRSSSLKSIWRSDRLAGSVLDVALNDPRGVGHGLAVLTNGGIQPGAPGHSLYFFQLE